MIYTIGRETDRENIDYKLKAINDTLVDEFSG